MAKYSLEKWESFISGVRLKIEAVGLGEIKIEVGDNDGTIPTSTIENLRAVVNEMEQINNDIKNKEL